jgi:hypothetical protein
MTSFGLETFAASGQVGLSTKDTAWSYVGFITVDAGQSVVQNFSAAAGMELMTQQWIPNVVPNDQEAYSHNVEVAGNTVNISNNGTVTTHILVLAQ